MQNRDLGRRCRLAMRGSGVRIPSCDATGHAVQPSDSVDQGLRQRALVDQKVRLDDLAPRPRYAAYRSQAQRERRLRAGETVAFSVVGVVSKEDPVVCAREGGGAGAGCHGWHRHRLGGKTPNAADRIVNKRGDQSRQTTRDQRPRGYRRRRIILSS